MTKHPIPAGDFEKYLQELNMEFAKAHKWVKGEVSFSGTLKECVKKHDDLWRNER